VRRQDFVFTIGFHGNAAIVDAKAKRKYGKLTTMELAELGLYRSGFASALYSGDQAEIDEFIRFYCEQTGAQAGEVADFKRLFGVDEAREVTKSIVV